MRALYIKFLNWIVAPAIKTLNSAIVELNLKIQQQKEAFDATLTVLSSACACPPLHKVGDKFGPWEIIRSTFIYSALTPRWAYSIVHKTETDYSQSKEFLILDEKAVSKIKQHPFGVGEKTLGTNFFVDLVTDGSTDAIPSRYVNEEIIMTLEGLFYTATDNGTHVVFKKKDPNVEN